MTDPGKRVVAIVGRPNVGKSALFNRLIGHRLSIVHEQSGVTRDRVVSECDWKGDTFELVDTGGIGDLDKHSESAIIDAGIHLQAQAALQDAGVVIFVVDIEKGLVPLDLEVAQILRESNIEVFLAANKADDVGKDERLVDFEQFGMRSFAVSALHGRGLEELMGAVMEVLPRGENLTVKDPLKVAIVGRPNVGKSSYVNRLLRDDRVIVSDIAGTTRDSIDIPFTVGRGEYARHYILTDTAGIRRRGKRDSTVEEFSYMRAESSIARADVVVQVMSADTGPTAQDKKIASMVQTENKGHIILINKWDLAEETQRSFGPELKRVMPFLDSVPIVYASAKTGFNIRNTIEGIDYVASQTATKLPTGVLNRVLLDAYERVQPKAVRGKRLKFYYATQTGTRPVTVTLFVNDTRRMEPNYRKFLIRSLRESFGLEGAPIVLELRRRRGEQADNASS